MVSKTYDSLGTTITVTALGSAVTVGFEDDIVLVGGYDAANADGSVTAGEIDTVDSKAEAAQLFGTDSELHHATGLAYANGIGQVYCLPVPETTGTTEQFGSTASGTLSNTPFDPNVHPEHDITASDDAANDIAVNVVYDDPPSTPSSSDTINLNPVTGDWEADASDTYDITYDYGDYSSAVLQTAVDQSARFVAVLTEDPSVKSTLQTELSNAATNFDFQRGVVGADPRIDSTAVSSYTPDTDDFRVIEVAPARGTLDGQDVRTAAAVGGAMAAQSLGASLYYDRIRGLDSLATEYTASTAEDFDRVTALTADQEVASAVTTSSESQFADVYAVEIADTIALAVYQIAQDYAGEPNFQENRRLLEANIRRQLKEYASQSPPLLATGDGGRPFDLNVSLGATDDTVDVDLGIEPVPTMKEIDVDLAVGDVVNYEGITA